MWRLSRALTTRPSLMCQTHQSRSDLLLANSLLHASALRPKNVFHSPISFSFNSSRPQAEGRQAGSPARSPLVISPASARAARPPRPPGCPSAVQYAQVISPTPSLPPAPAPNSLSPTFLLFRGFFQMDHIHSPVVTFPIV